jgi:hypothetical protein
LEDIFFIFCYICCVRLLLSLLICSCCIWFSTQGEASLLPSVSYTRKQMFLGTLAFRLFNNPNWLVWLTMHPPTSLTKDEFLSDNKLLSHEGSWTSPCFGESKVWGQMTREE